VPAATLTVDRMDGLRIDQVGVTLHPDNTNRTRTDDPGTAPSADKGGAA
jgi:hypothetical protein